MTLPLLSPVSKEPVVQLFLLAHSLLTKSVAIVILLTQNLSKNGILPLCFLLSQVRFLLYKDIVDLFVPVLGPFCIVECDVGKGVDVMGLVLLEFFEIEAEVEGEDGHSF